jgi:hypothetical protein
MSKVVELRAVCLVLILRWVPGCQCERPGEEPSTLQFVRACTLYGDAYRVLFAASADALGGGKDPALLDPRRHLPSVEDVRDDLKEFSHVRRPCEICQFLGDCAAGQGFSPFVGASTARFLAESGLALLGFTEPQEAPPEVRSALPPPGGPSLAHALFRVCASCPQETSAGTAAATLAQQSAWLRSCQRFKFAFFAAGGQDVRDSLIRLPEGWLWAFFPLDDCRTLEWCALQFLQLCHPREAFPYPPDEKSRTPAALAGFLDRLALEDIDGASSSLSTINPADDERRCIPAQPGSPGAGTFGAVLRLACREAWEP